MIKEIERKWLCDGWPEELMLVRDWDIEQIYIYVGEDIEVRIRKKTDRRGNKPSSYRLTIKLGNGIERIELESDMTEKEYEEFKSHNTRVPIKKHFRVYDLKGHELHFSFVDDEWFYAEIEFNSLAEAEQFNLPFNWQEVTNDNHYQMKNYWVRTRFQ